MAKFKPPKRLFKNKEVVHSYRGRRGNLADPTRSPAHRPDGLQHVEFAFAASALKDAQLDDRAVFEAVQLSMMGSNAEEPADPKVAGLRALIESVRETRSNVPDSEWAGSLRRVMGSIQNHSGLAPGEKSYLTFVRRYVS